MGNGRIVRDIGAADKGRIGKIRYNPVMSYVKWVRQRVGTRKIFLVTTSVVVTEPGKTGRFLLQHRTDLDVWGLPGGMLEIEEDVLTCARREVQEETGLTLGDLRLVGVYTHPDLDVTLPNGDEFQQFTFCFGGEVDGGSMQLDRAEAHDQRFFASADLANLAIPPWYRVMLGDALHAGPPTFERPYARSFVQDQIAQIRPFIGNDRLIGVGATAVVVRGDGRLLMIRRRDNDQWFFPSGYADLGETVAHTIIREVREETGLHIVPERIVGVYSSPQFHHTFPNGHQVKNVGVLFRARLVGGLPEIDATEISDMAWMTPDELLANTPTAYRLYFETAVRHLHQGYFLA